MLFQLLLLLFLEEFVVPLEVASASELLEHDHLVLPVVRRLLKQLELLLFLREVYDVGPGLLVLGLEVLEELIEALVPPSHALDRFVQGLARSGLVLLNEALQLFDVLKGAGLDQVLFLLGVRICEEEHPAFLVLVLCWVMDHVREEALGHSLS